MKYLYVTLVFLCTVFVASTALSMTLGWDDYTDPIATSLEIWSSTDGVNFTPAVSNIPTNSVSADVPDGPDYTRVYYYLKALSADAESDPSNTISFFWTTGGVGYEGPSTPGLIRLIDCDNVAAGSADETICNNRYTP